VKRLASLAVFAALLVGVSGRAGADADRGAEPPRFLFVLAPRGNDPTEVSMVWKQLRRRGIEVDFVTRDGVVPRFDPVPFNQVDGKGEPLSRWGRMRNRILLGPVMASREVKRAVVDIERETHRGSHGSPLGYREVEVGRYAGVYIAGGEGPGADGLDGMLETLEDPALHQLIRDFASAGKLVTWICHGGWAVAKSGLFRTYSRLRGATLSQWMEKLARVGFRRNGRDSIFLSSGKGSAEQVMKENMPDPARQYAGIRFHPLTFPLALIRRPAWWRHGVVESRDGDLVTISHGGPQHARPLGAAIADRVVGRRSWSRRLRLRRTSGYAASRRGR
jgi:putative intracellular protease/amidase